MRYVLLEIQVCGFKCGTRYLDSIYSAFILLPVQLVRQSKRNDLCVHQSAGKQVL